VALVVDKLQSIVDWDASRVASSHKGRRMDVLKYDSLSLVALTQLPWTDLG
jgi:hypothetical protein